MTPIRYAGCALMLGFLVPVWAINKCTDANGKVSFQDAPCAGQGEQIEVRPAIEGATPVQPPRSTAKEGAFGASWQRKHHLQTQAVPQARAAIERNQRECAAQPEEVTTHAGPLRRSTLPSGSLFAQDRAASDADSKAACNARTEALRRQLKSLEDELAKL